MVSHCLDHVDVKRVISTIEEYNIATILSFCCDKHSWYIIHQSEERVLNPLCSGKELYHKSVKSQNISEVFLPKPLTGYVLGFYLVILEQTQGRGPPMKFHHDRA